MFATNNNHIKLKTRIKGFLYYHFSCNKYSFKNYYIDYIQKKKPKFFNVKEKKVNNELNIIEWVEKFKKFQKVVVLASGPSLNKLNTLDKNNLYITTNSSVGKALKYNFIYFTFTKEYLNMYLRKGFNVKGWQGTIFRFTKSKSKHKNRMLGFDKVVDYKKKYSRKKPELLLSNLFNDSIEKDNFDELNNFIEQNLGFKFIDQNSGITILLIGYYIAKKLNKELHVYGLDVGIQGQKYYTKKDMPGKEISNDRAKNALDEIYNSMYNQKDFIVKNHSFYNGNIIHE